jgi:DNA-binding CsgD family transcriptional regulator
MYFGGESGISFFHPEAVGDSPTPPLVLVTAARGRENRPFLEDRGGGVRSVSLRRRDLPLTLELAALSFADPVQNQFAWRWEDGDAPLNYLSTRRALVLPDLPAGRHALRVLGSNSDGVWNMEGARLVIVVASESAWWLVPALAVPALAALAWLARRRLKKKRGPASLLQDPLPDLAPLGAKYSLSPRELEVLRLVLSGKTNKDIESALFISVETVKTHIQRIYKKTGVGSRLQLMNRVSAELRASGPPPAP